MTLDASDLLSYLQDVIIAALLSLILSKTAATTAVPSLFFSRYKILLHTTQAGRQWKEHICHQAMCAIRRLFVYRLCRFKI